MAIAHYQATTKTAGALHGGLGGPLAVVAAGALMLGAMFLPVVQNSDATTTGYAIQRDQQQLADLNARTYDLEAQIAALGASSRVHTEAARLGMAPAGRQSASLSVSVPAPAGAALPRSYLSAAAIRAAEPTSGARATASDR